MVMKTLDFEEHDTLYIHKNIFNIYYENNAISDEKDPPHANAYLGDCTFNIGSSIPI